MTGPRLLEGLPHPAFEPQLFEQERQVLNRVRNLYGSMFYAEPLDVAPALLQSVVDIVNDPASFDPRDPRFVRRAVAFMRISPLSGSGMVSFDRVCSALAAARQSSSQGWHTTMLTWHQARMSVSGHSSEECGSSVHRRCTTR